MPHCTDKNTLEYHTVAGSCETKNICKGGTLRMGIFFDGTGNDDAVEEEYSNVKKLFDVYTKKDLNVKAKTDTVSAYIRGVGSRQSANNEQLANLSRFEKVNSAIDKVYIKVQDTTGGGFGTGGHARINHMIYELQEAIKTFKSDTSYYPEFIDMDVFGFSRGAIQARHFVNVIKQGFYKLNGPYSDYKPKDFTIKTLNIFDSVSTFNVSTTVKPGTPLDLGWAYHIKAGWVDKIIHFMADDEYRVHFDGQSIENSQNFDYPADINKPLRTELVFLGAHSDIGGGYRKKHHGCNNNDLAKIYLNKMYEMAKANGVPFTGKGGNSWNVPDELNDIFEQIQDKYNKYPKLKIAHKKFRERIAYLSDPSSGKKIRTKLLSDLKASTDNYNKEMGQISAEIVTLSHRILKTQGTRREKASQELEQLREKTTALQNEHYANLKHVKAYEELKKAFNDNEKDYHVFLALAVDFHNTYVHKSHSSMLGAKDYDADGNIIGTRDKVMGAEVDGILTWYLHRHVYHRDYDNVMKKLCEKENAKKTQWADYVSPGRKQIRQAINYTAYRWATPKKLAI